MQVKAKGKPYPFQLEAIKYHKTKRSSLNMFQMGLGKSLIALHSMEGLTNILIVCPAYLKSNWKDEIDKWTTGGNFTVVSYEGLKNVKGNFDGVIADEIHYCKNKDSQRTKRVFRLAMSKPKKFIGLTGTPVSKNVIDFWAILKIVMLDKLPYDYWQYCHKFSNKQTMKIKGRNITQFEGLKNAPLLSSIVAHCGIRKRTEQVIDLPSKTYKFIKIKDFKEKLDSEFESYLIDNKITKNIMSYKLVNAREKVPYTVNLVKDLLSQGSKVVIFTDHVEACEKLASEFKVPAIHGQAKTSRSQVVRDFENGKYKVIVATITSLNTGVNLVSSNYMVFNDFNYSHAENSQAEARIRRIGQIKPCFYYYLFASALDKRIYEINERKKYESDTILKEGS